jgi:leucyl aminopeptidase
MAGASTPSSYSTTSPVKATASVLVLGAADSTVLGLEGAKAARTALNDAAEAIGFTGSAGTTARVPAPKGVAAESVMLVGLGDFDAASEDVAATHEALRRAAGAALRALDGVETIALALPTATAAEVEAVTVGAGLGAYRFLDYRSEGKTPGELTVIGPKGKSFKAAHDSGAVIAAATNRARDLVNTPPLDLYPESYAEIVRTQAKTRKLKVTVLGEKELQAGGYGGIIGVGQGSTRGPRLVKVEYAPKGAKRHLSFVGKGITFDSGGHLPQTGQEHGGHEVRYGRIRRCRPGSLRHRRSRSAGPGHRLAAAGREHARVVGAASPATCSRCAAASGSRSRTPTPRAAWCSPDALSDADSDKPDLLIDVATLTGLRSSALGERTSGVMGAETAREEVVSSATAAGESMWAMPIPEEMLAGFDSTAADLTNSGPRSGGMLAAAAFLREFVGEDTNWAHIDIAGPSFNSSSPFGYTRRRPPAPRCAPSSRSRRPRAEKQVLHAVEVNVIIATCGQSDSVSFRPGREKWKDKTESCVPPAYSQLRGVIRE